MAKNQPRDDKHPYQSPTTPGLHVIFRNYIIELVCCNCSKRSLGARFWSDVKYWGPKYRREIKGISNLSKLLDFDDPIIRRGLIEIVQEHNIKALIAKKTIDRIVKLVSQRKQKLTMLREDVSSKSPPQIVDVEEFGRRNAKIVDTGEKSVLAKVRDIESGKKD